MDRNPGATRDVDSLVRNLIAEHETILSAISDAFSALDRDWRYTYVNDKVAELAGRLMLDLRDTHELRGIARSGFGATGFAEHITKSAEWERLRDDITRALAARANSNGAAK